MSSRRRRSLTTIAVLAVLAAGGITLKKLHIVSFSTSTPTTTTVPSAEARYLAEEQRAVAAAEAQVNATLPRKEGSPAPVLGSPAYRRAIAPHEVVGFFPSYELPRLGALDLAGLTEVVYYGLQVEPGGAVLERPAASLGWAAIENGAAYALIKKAHADGDRVLLGAFTVDQRVINDLSGPGATAAGKKLARELIPVISANHFDGVDLDLEGQATGDRLGFVRFVSAFSGALRASNPTLTLLLNTYPQAAGDPTSFFDVQALAPLVSQLFVMAYDMNDPEIPSANAPLFGPALNDASTLATYDAGGLGPKVILGVPFYGYDFPASRAQPPADTTGTPYTVTYSDILQSIEHDGHKAVWDPESETPYSSFRRAGQWHQTWFDDPVSIALKTALAAQFHVAGVGAWELGMADDAPQMLTVLAGDSPVLKMPLARR
jgi:hypothetical protein